MPQSIQRGCTRAHHALVHACVDYLALEGIPAVPISTTGVPVFVSGVWARLKGNPAQVGMADIIGCLPDGGRLLWVECKTGNARPTKMQEAKAERFAAAGAVVVIAGSVTDLAEVVSPHLSHPKVLSILRARMAER